MVLVMQVSHRGDSESNGVVFVGRCNTWMKTEAFGKALLPRPQSTVGTIVQMAMQPDR